MVFYDIVGFVFFVIPQAHAHLEELQGRLPGIHLTYYVNMRTIEAIHKALALPMDKIAVPHRMNGFRAGGGGENEEEEGEFVEEEVIDDMYGGGDRV